jgi:hypothetical protein
MAEAGSARRFSNIVPGRDEVFPPAGELTNSGGGTTPPPATPTIYPFDAIITDGGSGTVDIAIQPGTINGLLPTNWATTYNISNVVTRYLILSCSSSAGTITSCSLSLSSSPPSGIPNSMGTPPTAFDYLLGIIVNGVWFRAMGPDSLAAAGSEVYRVSKTAPAPGTLPYDSYYTWLVNT